MHCYVRYLEVKNHPHSLCLPEKKKKKSFLTGMRLSEPRLWTVLPSLVTVISTVTVTQDSQYWNTSQLISIDLIDTNGLSWNLITLCTEQKARSANIKAGRAWASKSRNKFQALTSLQLGRHTGTKNTIWTFHSHRSLSWLTRRQGRPLWPL